MGDVGDYMVLSDGVLPDSRGAEWAAATTGQELAQGGSTLRSIAIGVGTGLTVWLVTRALDRMFQKGETP
jgi:ribose 5-phosphate isomerase